MTNAANPALDRFVAQLRDEMTLAQVLIRRAGAGFELRHVDDRAAAPDSLRLVAPSELRALAQCTAAGAFRPLKCAPNLVHGWRAVAASADELEGAVGQVYPGAIADWFAAQSTSAPVTHYREFTARQTGMYRITTMLDDAQASTTIRACCHARFCLKRRFWTVEELEPDAAGEKSVIPCLEPCALLLEFARKSARLEQEEQVSLAVAPGDLESLRAALVSSLDHPSGSEREADFGADGNPRRLQLALEKVTRALSAARPAAKPGSDESQ